MIRVRTASRLHFGLLSFPGEQPLAVWPNFRGEAVVPARWFGGVGLMIESPGLELTAINAPEWSATGPLAERVLKYAQRVAATFPSDRIRPQAFQVVRAAPEHAGLGTGTQLGLAVARAATMSCGMPEQDVAELGRSVGRGARSAIGVHGFAHGGLLVEAGKREGEALAPLVARASFPAAWRLVVALPQGQPGVHGPEESLSFERLRSHPVRPAVTDALCRLVLQGLLPELQEADLAGFGEALYDFNARVGEAFAPVQGGTYASAKISDLVQFFRRQGVRGVGQSSWGPAVFAVVGDAEHAEGLVRALDKHGTPSLAAVWVTGACNHGACVTEV
jgi:beta-RFAP synthase